MLIIVLLLGIFLIGYRMFRVPDSPVSSLFYSAVVTAIAYPMLMGCAHAYMTQTIHEDHTIESIAYIDEWSVCDGKVSFTYHPNPNKVCHMMFPSSELVVEDARGDGASISYRTRITKLPWYIWPNSSYKLTTSDVLLHLPTP